MNRLLLKVARFLALSATLPRRGGFFAVSDYLVMVMKPNLTMSY